MSKLDEIQERLAAMQSEPLFSEAECLRVLAEIVSELKRIDAEQKRLHSYKPT